MIMLLLSFLILAESHEYPRIGYLIVSPSFSEKDMEEIEDWGDHIDELIDECEDDHDNFSSDQREICESYYESITSIVLSNGRDINEKLAKISKKTDHLFYMVQARHINVDFNNLGRKMEVYMHPIILPRSESITDDIGKLVYKVTKRIIQSSFDGTQESRIRLSQLIQRDIHHENTEVLIEGSISQKVSFLTISHLRVIYYNDFKCDNVYLSSGVLVSMINLPARVNNFIIDTQTFSYYSILKNLETDQFTLVDFNRDNDSIPEYQIAYYDLFWGIQCVFDGIFDHHRYHWKVPYFVTKRLAIICYSNHVVIDAVNQSLTDYKDVNITVTDEALIDDDDIEPDLSSSDKNEISIESKGFDGVSKKLWPSVFVTYDKEKFSLDKSKSDLDVEENQIYTPKPEHSKNHALIVGVVVTCVVVVVVIVVVVVVVVLKKRNANKDDGVYEKTLLNDQNQPSNNYHDPSLQA